MQTLKQRFIKRYRELAQGKKGIFGLSNAATGIVGLGIVLAVGALILTKVQDQTVSGSAAFNASKDSLSGLTTMSSFIPIVAIAVIGSILIALFVSRSGEQ